MNGKFSIGNRKLSKNVLIWNLPRLRTCPGAGACMDWCYEIKIERMYKNTYLFRNRNYTASLQLEFVEDMVAQLKKKKQPYVRIHECGDFYSQAYLDKWKEIARRCPEKQFFCFTKSFHLDLWKHLPSNFQIMQSNGSKWDQKIDWTRATNRIKYHSAPVNRGETKCPGNGCGDTCSICIPTSNIHLVMDLHR